MNILHASMVLFLICAVVINIALKKKRASHESSGFLVTFVLFLVIMFLAGGFQLFVSEVIIDSKSYTEEIVETYPLVSLNTASENRSEFKGSIFLLSGTVYGESEEVRKYQYCYKREDGGMLFGEITSEEATVVVYETDEVSPRYDIYRGERVLPSDFHNRELYEFLCVDKKTDNDVIEYRFYVPVGTFIRSGSYILE